MVHYFPVIIGKFPDSKKKFLESKITNKSSFAEFLYLDNGKFKVCSAMSEVNQALSTKIDHQLYGGYVETVFYLSTSSPLYKRLERSGYRVVSTDSLLRNYQTRKVGKAFKKFQTIMSSGNPTKEKTRRLSHAVCY